MILSHVQEAHLEIRCFELLDHLLWVSSSWAFVAFEVLAVHRCLCRTLFVVCQADSYTHITGFVGGSVCVFDEDIAAIWDIRLCLDRSFMLSLGTKARILIEHAFLVLSNLDFMVCDFIPVDLTSTEIHWRFVETFLMLFLSRDHCTQDFRNIFVAIMILNVERFFGAWRTRDRGVISFHWANFSKTNVAF